MNIECFTYSLHTIDLMIVKRSLLITPYSSHIPCIHIAHPRCHLLVNLSVARTQWAVVK